MVSKSRPDPELPVDLVALPYDWVYKPLSSLVDPTRGISYGIVQPGASDPSGVPIVRVNDIKQGHITTDAILRIRPELEAQYARTRLRGGEVLLTLVGTLGECAIVPDQLAGWNVARAIGVIPVLPEVGARWVSLCLRSRSIQQYIQMWATTTVQATFNLRDVGKLPIPLPPVRERDRLAAMLGSLDDKIELNRRTNATLEAMARTLFQSWFVDFDPVRAKAEGRQPAGMDAATAALFPDAFEDSPLGEIPQGWTIVPFASFADLSRGSINPGNYPLANFEHYSIPAFDAGRMPTIDLGESIKSNTLLVTDGCVLLSKLNPRLPRVWLPGPITSDYAVTSTEFLVVTPSASMSREYVYELCCSPAFAESFEAMVTGTSSSHQRVNATDLLAMKVVVPVQPLVAAYTRCIKPILKLVYAKQVESRNLAAIRDALLPKLLSGELRAAEARQP